MERMNVLLVDDEYLALNLLEEYLKQVPNAHLVAKCKSPLEAMQILEKEEIDILFLDIQMPALSGVSLLSSLSKAPATVFTTAYRDYAIEAFDLNAIDYLVKPFPFERFLKAYNRASAYVDRSLSKVSLEATTNTYFTIKADGKLIRIYFDDILLVEGLKEYVRIICKEDKYVTFERLKNMENLLPNKDFIRVHKSYIVARRAVKALEGNMLDLGIRKVPISRTKKEEIVADLFMK